MLRPSLKMSPFQKLLKAGGEEREILLSNLLIIKQYNHMFLCHSQRQASTRQANHLQNYCKKLALSYVQAEQHSQHLHMTGFITQERPL